MNPNDFARLRSDGAYDLSPAAVLLLSADTAYGDPRETTAEGRRNALYFIDETIAAAVAGGFKRADILRTRLARLEMGPQVVALAQEAIRAAGAASMQKIYRTLGL